MSLLPAVVRAQLCALLDRPQADECDWRRLVATVMAPQPCYVQFFGLRPSPTAAILDLWTAIELASPSAEPLRALLAALRRMRRTDCLALLEPTA